MRLWRSWRFRRPRPGRKLHPTPKQAIAMDSEFHPAALSDSDHGACGALPSESGLEMLMRMPGMGFMGEICDDVAATAGSVSGEMVAEAPDLPRG